MATQLLFFVIHFRSDCYGGSFENYVRFVVVATEAMRAALPDDVVLSVRVSSTVWGTGGWTIEETVELAFRVPRTGADLIDCGAGGIAAKAPVPLGSGHEEPFAERARHEAGVPTTAVALITEPTKTDAIVRNWQADWVLKGRGDPCAIQTGH